VGAKNVFTCSNGTGGFFGGGIMVLDTQTGGEVISTPFLLLP